MKICVFDAGAGPRPGAVVHGGVADLTTRLGASDASSLIAEGRLAEAAAAPPAARIMRRAPSPSTSRRPRRGGFSASASTT